ncbi:tetratricopeptide repeat protein [bacterium]|nr:tetratricopeptide repeat protein [candidate division CSSED10-310 bacterium]
MTGYMLYRGHLVFVILLCLWMPLSVDADFSTLAWVYGLFSAAAVVAVCQGKVSGRGSKTWEIMAYLAVVAGIVLSGLSMDTPSLSPDNFPPLGIFNALSGLAMAVFILVAQGKNISPVQIGIWTTLYSSNLFLTQALDKYPYAIICPFLAVLVTRIYILWHPSEGEGGNPLRIPLAAATAYLLLFIIQGWNHQSRTFYVDVVLLFTALLTVDVAGKCAGKRGCRCGSILFIWQSLTICCLVALGLWRLIWLSQSFGFATSATFKLWVALIHPNAIGACVAGSLPVLMSAEIGKMKNGSRIFLLSVSIIVLLATLSRGSWISCLVVAAAYLSWLWIHRERMQGRVFINKGLWMAGASVLVFGVVLIGAVTYRIFNAETLHNRLLLWKTALNGIASRPLFGHGIGDHDSLSRFVTDPFHDHIMFFADWYKWDRLGRHFHSILIEIPWLFGATGTALFLWILAALIHGMFRNRGRIQPPGLHAAAGFFILVLTGLFDCVFYYPALLILAAMLLGIATGNMRLASEPGPYAPSGLLRRLKVPILLVLICIEIPGVMFPFLGTHWKARGLMKRESEPWWALSAFEKAVFYRPWDADIHLEIVSLHLVLGQTDSVYDDFEKIHSHHPDAARINAILAWLAPSSVDRIRLLKNAVTIDPAGLSGMEHFSDLGMASCIEGDMDRGMKTLKKAYLLDPILPGNLLSMFPRIPGGVITRSKLLSQYLGRRFGEGCFNTLEIPETLIPVESALDSMEREFSADRKSGVNRKKVGNLARSRLYMGDFEGAVRIMNRWNLPFAELTEQKNIVDAFDADSPEYLLIQAEKALRMGDLESAESLFDRVFKKGMDHPRVHWGMGEIALMRSQWLQARTEYEKARETAPEFAEIHERIGTVDLHLGRLDSARSAFEKALELNPYSFQSLRALGLMHFNEREFEQSRAFLIRALRLKPDDPEIRRSLDVCLEKAGKTDEILKEQNRSAQPDPTQESMHRLQPEHTDS